MKVVTYRLSSVLRTLTKVHVIGVGTSVAFHHLLTPMHDFFFKFCVLGWIVWKVRQRRCSHSDNMYMQRCARDTYLTRAYINIYIQAYTHTNIRSHTHIKHQQTRSHAHTNRHGHTHTHKLTHATNTPFHNYPPPPPYTTNSHTHKDPFFTPTHKHTQTQSQTPQTHVL